MALAGRRYTRRGQDPYSRSSFAAKREYQHRLAGAVREQLYACKLCELPVKVLGRERKGHLQRSHAGQEQGRSLRMLFKAVKW